MHLLAGLDELYHRATSSLTSIRGNIQSPEQRSLFKGKVSSASWTHKFVCLESPDAERVPTTQAVKSLLEEAGLGEKMLEVPVSSCNEDMEVSNIFGVTAPQKRSIL